eukprot:TRINITY_DN2424_c0_g1_i1.p1 TRINITY_DN2424_c0_g1~~TRINITY_DN2424_c0_g1_i1.p1  ORF type:complete len:523 (+),score=164.49 TRINITY_DN2424_c0_g1_i1:162-1571(+)
MKELCDALGNFAPICFDLTNEPTAADLYVEKYGKIANPPPAILFPGLGGSGIQARLHKDNTPLFYCFKTWNWFGLWVQLYQGVLAQPCWLENLGITYFPSNNTYGDTKGIDTKPHDFGGLNGVNKLDHFDDPFGLTDYYEHIIKELEKVGFVANKTIFGAPYDWRLPVDILYNTDINLDGKTFHQDLEDLVETAYIKSGQQKVNFVTHSMGGPTALYFLNRQTPEWKQKYMGNLVTIAGPWSGAPKALKAILSGDNFGLEVLGMSLLNRDTIAQIARNSGGVNYLTPDPLFWQGDIFVTENSTSKKYNSTQFEQLYVDIKTPDTAIIHNKTNMLIQNLIHPDIPLFCLYGVGVETEMAYKYQTFSADPAHVVQPYDVLTNDYGDGTVPLLSLGECKKWQKELPSNPVKCKEYELISHSQILKERDLVGDLIDILTNKPTDMQDCSKTPKYDKLIAERLAEGKKVDPKYI